MGVAPGSPVSASNTNSAFIDANGDDTGIGKYALANTDPISGNQVDNIQRELNALDSYTGNNINAVKAATPGWTHNEVGNPADNLFTRSNNLTERFNDVTGHTHDGTVGDGPKIHSVNVDQVPLEGVYKQGTDRSSVTGSSSNVTSVLGGETPSTSSSIKGIVVNAPYNIAFVRQASGVDENDNFTDGSGNVVYGRLTESSGTWTLSYYVKIGSVETAYSFSSASNIRWYYQQLYSRIVDTPVYSELSNIPSDNATADVIDATETQAGKVVYANTSPTSPIDSTGSRGNVFRAAHADHAHVGTHSVGVYGDATKLVGDIDLEAGSSVTITRTGQRIKIDGSGAVGFQEVPAGLVNGSNVTFGPFTQTPSSADSIIVFIDGVALERSLWSFSGLSVTLTVAPTAGEVVYVWYLTQGVPTPPPAPVGTVRVEYRTITAPEDSAKKIILSFTPATAISVMLDVIGGTSQEFNVDYTVVSNELRWNGYALDGVLTTGDKLRVWYQS